MAELASLIRGAVNTGALETLDAYQMAYCKAHTMRDPESLRVLVKCAIASLPTGMYSFRGIEKLVRIHFGQSISMVSVRTDLRCRMDQVKDYRIAVFKKMAEIRAGLIVALEALEQERRAA